MLVGAGDDQAAAGRARPRDDPALGPEAVVVTGGHREEAIGHCSSTASRLVEMPGERYPDGAAHGSGCTHSSTLAAQLARSARRR